MLMKTTRVQRLKIEDFRGIRSLELDFDRPVTVLVGVNGVGKTSIIEALRLLLYEISDEVLDALRRNRLFVSEKQPAIGVLDVSDIRLGCHFMSLHVNTLVEGQSLEWSIRGSVVPNGFLEMGSSKSMLKALVQRLFEQEKRSSEVSLPLAIYYSLGGGPRKEVELPGEDVGMAQFWAYDGALTGAGLSSSARFVDWFRRLEDYENERRTEDTAFRDKQLQAVRSVVEQLLPGFSGLRIRRQPTRMVIRKNQVELELNHLSAGERYMLGLGADIARRLSLANPAAEKAHLCSAIVLIDEIETHLHPSWQRRVIPSLMRAFPNCQFIVATHSPQVLSNVKPESIYVLTQEDGEIRVTHPEASFGRDSNRILEDLMGVDERPREIKAKLGEYFQLIDEGRTEEAQVLRRELEASIGASDPEFTRADVLLHTRELLSR